MVKRKTSKSSRLYKQSFFSFNRSATLFFTKKLFQRYLIKISIYFPKILRLLKRKFGFSLKKLKRIFIFRKKERKAIKKSPFISPLSLKLKYFSLGSFFSFLFIFIPLLFFIYLQDLPNPAELANRQIAQTTKIYDRNKILLFEIYTNQNRTLVSLEDIPQRLRQATLAIEDKNFYQHPGFDLASIIRALKENFLEGKTLQGGSTLTQQLIKSSLLTSEKKISRKIKEIILAFWAERIYSKDEILEMYFNQVPYGGTAWGVGAASEVYFEKKVKDLTLAESAFLAGITQAPSLYSPYSSQPSVWKKRQQEVLNRMVALGYITKEDAKKASNEKLHFKDPKVPLRAPHFVMYIKDLLIKQHGLAAVEKGGLTVITSLDITKQEMAEKIVAEEVAKSSYLQLSNGAVLITNPKNGDIIAMVGSKDYQDKDNGNVNLTTSLRQPGSTVKVITYSAALTKGYTALSLLEDTPMTFQSEGAPPYSPVNYDGRYFGKVTLRFALANSLNLPAVKTLQKVGIKDMLDLAKDMGITTWNSPERYGLSLTLGGAEATMLDMATVFGTLSNYGERVDLNPILLVTDYKGAILEQKKEVSSIRVLSEGVAYIISDILRDNKTRSTAFGSNSPLVIPNHTVAVKTGTSDNKRDNWTIGYTNDYVVTTWVGNNDNTPMSQSLASGITGAAPIWHEVMKNLLKDTKDRITVPSDVVVKNCMGRDEYFLKGTENTVYCTSTPNKKVFSVQ